MAVIAYAQFGQDFRGYFAAARVLTEGGNPYDYYQVAPILLETTGHVGNNPFYYPLWFGWMLSPLVFLTYTSARAAWMTINLVLWIIGLIRLQGLMNFPRNGWQTWLLNLLATFIFAWMTWKFEQAGILLFAITVEIMIAYKNNRWLPMGIYLSAVLIKPNIMLLPAAILCLWLIRNKIFRPVLIMTGVLFSLIIITTVLTPKWHQPIFQSNFGQGLTEVLDGPNQTTGVRLNTTMLDWLGMFRIPGGMQIVIYGITIVTALALIGKLIWHSKSFMQVTVIALLVNFAITPYSLQYDFPPMTIVLFWSLALALKAKSIKLPAVLIIFIASVLFWERPISDGYWIVVGLCAMVFWSLWINKGAQLPENLI